VAETELKHRAEEESIRLHHDLLRELEAESQKLVALASVSPAVVVNEEKSRLATASPAAAAGSSDDGVGSKGEEKPTHVRLPLKDRVKKQLQDPERRRNKNWQQQQQRRNLTDDEVVSTPAAARIAAPAAVAAAAAAAAAAAPVAQAAPSVVVPVLALRAGDGSPSSGSSEDTARAASASDAGGGNGLSPTMARDVDRTPLAVAKSPKSPKEERLRLLQQMADDDEFLRELRTEALQMPDEKFSVATQQSPAAASSPAAAALPTTATAARPAPTATVPLTAEQELDAILALSTRALADRVQNEQAPAAAAPAPAGAGAAPDSTASASRPRGPSLSQFSDLLDNYAEIPKPTPSQVIEMFEREFDAAESGAARMSPPPPRPPSTTSAVTATAKPLPRPHAPPSLLLTGTSQSGNVVRIVRYGCCCCHLRGC
jgi:hypothetical protein